MGEKQAERLASIVDRAGRAACWLFIPLILLIVFDVVGRRFLSMPTVMLQELQWYLHGILLLLTIGYGYLAQAHVRIDILSERLSDVRVLTLRHPWRNELPDAPPRFACRCPSSG